VTLWALMEVLSEDEIMLITAHGVIIRSSVSHVRVTGRIAQGVRLVNLDQGDLVTAVARVIPEDQNGVGTSEGEGDSTDIGDEAVDVGAEDE